MTRSAFYPRVSVFVAALLSASCKFTDDYQTTNTAGALTCAPNNPSYHIGEACQSPGACGAGLIECAGPFTTRCSSGPDGSASAVQLEVCDGIDNDCDGVVDETCDCVAGATRPCGVDLGHCTSGEQLCTSGVWGECSGKSPEDEVCNGIDDNCDGSIDEGCECAGAATRPCGTTLGECTDGTQKCSAGSWGSCSGIGPATELCNGKDDDCDGEVDDGFDINAPCTLAAGCPGTRQCSADGTATECVIDETARAPDICDGVDNDCDGLVDAYLTPRGLVSSCACVTDQYSFGTSPTPGDPSAQDLAETDPDYPHAFCAPTQCLDSSGALDMQFCLNCGQAAYAQCVSQNRFDLSPFIASNVQEALSITFSFDSDSAAQAAVNFYYQLNRKAGKDAVSVRRYFPLLRPGDAPGTYTRVFVPDSQCFASDEATHCGGSSQAACSECRFGDTCGVPQGADCESIRYDQVQLQVAIEDCSSDTAFAGTIRIQKVTVGAVACRGG